MQQFIVADSVEFQADLQKKLDKMKQEIISELNSSLDKKKPETKYLTRREVTEKYRISLVTLYNLTTKMKLASLKIGARRLYEANELERYFTAGAK
jgi:hypothetical protein